MRMNELERTTNRNRTMPWSSDEYMLVDGMKVVYTVGTKTGGILVRLPGGGKETVTALEGQGRVVTMPKTFRTEYAEH